MFYLVDWNNGKRYKIDTRPTNVANLYLKGENIMTVDDVLEGLKHCKENDIRFCHRCPYCGVYNCNIKLKEDALNAIKELQVQFDALKKTLKATIKNSRINFGMWKESQAEVERLLAQLQVVEGSAGMSKLEIAKKIIKENYNEADCGIYNSRNVVGDQMHTIYDDGELQIDICYYCSYFEVFGLSCAEFRELEVFYNGLIQK